MSEPFIGQISIVGFQFAPRGWALCNGQLLPINQNQALFSILGTTYGGNGQTTFALPDLRGRTPFHVGQGAGLSSYVLGQRAGEESHTLSASEMPLHNHLPPPASANPAAVGTPVGNLWANDPTLVQYAPTPNTSMAAGATAAAGGSQPHNNLSPCLVVNFVIALQGIFPSRN